MLQLAGAPCPVILGVLWCFSLFNKFVQNISFSYSILSGLEGLNEVYFLLVNYWPELVFCLAFLYVLNMSHIYLSQLSCLNVLSIIIFDLYFTLTPVFCCCIVSGSSHCCISCWNIILINGKLSVYIAKHKSTFINVQMLCLSNQSTNMR